MMSLQLDYLGIAALDHLVPCLLVHLLQCEVSLAQGTSYLAQQNVKVLEPHMYPWISQPHSTQAVK